MSMATLFVQYYADWHDSDADNQSDFHDHLKARDLLGDGDGQISFLSWWHCLPLDRPIASVTDYAVMDFHDGSIAVRRNHGDELRWLVAA